jgi:hypothetical protein
MDVTTGPLESRFQQSLEEFKKTLSQDDIHDFTFTTLDDLKKLVLQIQRDQATSSHMKNLKRIAPFLEAIDQYDKIVQIFLNCTNYIAFIWASNYRELTRAAADCLLGTRQVSSADSQYAC